MCTMHAQMKYFYKYIYVQKKFNYTILYYKFN